VHREARARVVVVVMGLFPLFVRAARERQRNNAAGVVVESEIERPMLMMPMLLFGPCDRSNRWAIGLVF
jgi:hypothetical protein